MELVEEIERQNLHWRGRKLSEDTMERYLENSIKDELDEDIITAITGMRQVGKTTLVRRIIDMLVEDNRPENILYYSFDIEKVSVRNLIETYFREIRNEDVEEAEKTYVFLDEVQKTEDWGDHVKSYHDTYDNLKFIVTGSSSANIRKGGGESLVGRISLHQLFPFTFREFLRYKGIKVPERDFGGFERPKNARKIRNVFEEYMKTGGFPGLLEFEDTKRLERLKDIIDLSLYRDVVEIHGIGRPELLEGLFKIFSANSGQIISYNKISKDLNAQYRTVKKYIESLRSSFLISISRRFENSVFKQYRKSPKIYVSEHSFCRMENTKEGLIAETMAFNHLKTIGNLGHFREEKKEVDIVLEKNNELKGFEVKYRKDIGKKDFRGLKAFSETYPDAETFMLTRDERGKEKGVRKIPLWLFLLHI